MLKKALKVISKNYLWVIALISLIVVFLIIKDIYGNKVLIDDLFTRKYIVSNLRSDFLSTFFTYVTNLGGSIFIVFITFLLFIIIKDRNTKLYLIINLLLIFLLNLFLKNIIQRHRPFGFNLISVSGYSFPSGHAMVSFAVYGFIIYLIYKNVSNKFIKVMGIVLVSLLILVIGFSRVYLGVHFMSDVIAGSLISLVYLIIFVKVYNRVKLL